MSAAEMSLRFTVNIECDNDAFDDGTGGTEEVARILERLAVSILDGYNGGPLYDVNGNLVGSWSFHPASES